MLWIMAHDQNERKWSKEIGIFFTFYWKRRLCHSEKLSFSFSPIDLSYEKFKPISSVTVARENFDSIRFGLKLSMCANTHSNYGHQLQNAIMTIT